MKNALANRKALRRAVHPLAPWLWILDFDGTLSPLVPHSDDAVMSRAARRLLVALSRRCPGRVVVLSGRALADLRARVRLPGLIYSGDHGRDIEGLRLRYTRPVSARARSGFRSFARYLTRAVRGIPGAWVEKKRHTLSLHFRQTPRPDRIRLDRLMVRSVRPWARRSGFMVQPGKAVWNFAPDHLWNKGAAARWLRRRLDARRIFFIGDDQTDETVFRTLHAKDIGVRVGHSHVSQAGYFVPRQRDVLTLLRALLRRS